MNQPYLLFDAYSTVVELRRYTLHPGRRDELVELFERELVESQEAEGMRLVGQFRDLDHPDRFVWLRGFADMAARGRALPAFYGGPVWKAHRDAANATMLDSDDVRLLRPAYSASGFQIPRLQRPPRGSTGDGSGLVVGTVYRPHGGVDRDFLDFFQYDMVPLLDATGAPVTAALVTETAANNFPALPVRGDERVFAWFARFDGPGAYAHHLRRLAAHPNWEGVLAPALRSRLSAPPEVLRLVPTVRSRLQGLEHAPAQGLVSAASQVQQEPRHAAVVAQPLDAVGA